MTSAIDVAGYILEKFGTMTTMKLQKLVFYSQAYYSAWNQKPLFSEAVRAWTHGPVVYELFKLHRGFHEISADELRQAKPGALTPEEKEAIDTVCEALGGLTGWELRNRTHDELPWRQHFNKSSRRHNEEIPLLEMQDFYSKH